LLVLCNLIGQEVSIGGGLRERPEAGISEPENGGGIRKAPLVLAQEPFHFLFLIRSEPVRQVDRVNHDDDFNRRIRLG
jgi:hypothetical protein